MIIPLSWIHADFEFFTCMFDFAMIMAQGLSNFRCFIFRDEGNRKILPIVVTMLGVSLLFLFLFTLLFTVMAVFFLVFCVINWSYKKPEVWFCLCVFCFALLLYGYFNGASVVFDEVGLVICFQTELCLKKRYEMPVVRHWIKSIWRTLVSSKN